MGQACGLGWWKSMQTPGGGFRSWSKASCSSVVPLVGASEPAPSAQALAPLVASQHTAQLQDANCLEKECGNETVSDQNTLLQRLTIDSPCSIFNVNLHEGTRAQCRQNIEGYFHLHRDNENIYVTTSCFKIWRQHKKTNGYAKVIPAISAGSDDGGRAVRVFFFDDNLEWEGGEHSPGICNLRDVVSGTFVDFGEGKNGFQRTRAARHTVIYHSSQYRNVLIKANILDAMEHADYFQKIIQRFSLPGEKLIIYMDVNSTIVVNDTVQGKDLGGMLLGVMFDCVELRPRGPSELKFDMHPPVRIEKPLTLKSIVRELTHSDHLAYSAFWNEEKCWRLFMAAQDIGDMIWASTMEPISIEGTRQLFQEYLVSLERFVAPDGIAPSWFTFYESVKDQHTVVLNSFGVDTRKVLLSTLHDDKDVTQLAVNYELWDARDVKQFSNQFAQP